jgi:transketolase
MNNISLSKLKGTKLNERSKKLRLETLKLSKANGGYHYGGTFSCTEILINLYDSIITENDRFILSKGHACWAYYVLLRERGYDPPLEGHPHLDLNNGVHWTTGSEGHGLPAGIGMALAKKLKNREGKIYVVMGDGECQEGTTWESMLTAPHRKLDNIVVIVDNNNIQGSGFVNEILPIDCLEQVAESCGWEVVTINGHNNKQIVEALKHTSNKPYMIIAKTVKGKGVSYMENEPSWHAQWPDPEHEKIAIGELSK